MINYFLFLFLSSQTKQQQKYGRHVQKIWTSEPMVKLVFECVMAFSLTCQKVFLTRIGSGRKGGAIMDSSIALLPNIIDNGGPNLIDCDCGNIYYVFAANLIDCRPTSWIRQLRSCTKIFSYYFVSGLVLNSLLSKRF